MIVFDLKCSHDHTFEAWFGSSTDYEDQKARGLVSCPLCDDVAIEKAVMAPAVAAKGNQRPDPVPAPASGRPLANMAPEDAAKLQAVIQKLAEVQAEVLSNSAWVGDAFADKARAMHYGDEPQASIHGTALIEEAQALAEEGIAIAALPIPIVPPEERN
jgi:hypothetical protein